MRGQLGSHPGTRPLPRPHPTTEASEASETSPSETSEERRVLSCFPCQTGVGLSYTKLYLHCLFNSSQRKLAKLKRFCSPYAAGLGTQHPSAFLRQSPKSNMAHWFGEFGVGFPSISSLLGPWRGCSPGSYEKTLSGSPR